MALEDYQKRTRRAFTQGYVCAVATLVKAHGAGTEAKDLLNCIKVDWRTIEKYDRDILKKAGLIKPSTK